MTTIGPHITIVGEIACAEDLLIEGRVTGNVHVKGAMVTIGERANLEANMHCGRIRIMGTVRGAITATERIDLAASASVVGSLSANHVTVEDGATFKGRIDMARRTIAAKVAQYRSSQPA